MRLAMKVGQEQQPALSEVRVAQAVVDRGRVAERPPGLAPGVDLSPHVFSFDAQLDETPRDRAFTFPVAQNDRAQPAPDVSVERAHHPHLRGGGDSEETRASRAATCWSWRCSFQACLPSSWV